MLRVYKTGFAWVNVPQPVGKKVLILPTHYLLESLPLRGRSDKWHYTNFFHKELSYKNKLNISTIDCRILQKTLNSKSQQKWSDRNVIPD